MRRARTSTATGAPGTGAGSRCAADGRLGLGGPGRRTGGYKGGGGSSGTKSGGGTESYSGGPSGSRTTSGGCYSGGNDKTPWRLVGSLKAVV